MEANDQNEVKESRTQRLMRRLNIPPDFEDPKLPSKVFSYSQYNSWLICAKAYEFKYVEKRKTPNYAATSKGSAVHAGIEHMLRGKQAGQVPTFESGVAEVNKKFDEMAQGVEDWGRNEDTPLDPEEVKESARRLFQTFAIMALPHINPVAVEKGFAKKIGDVPLIGYIDLIDERPTMNTAGMDPATAALAPKKRVTVDSKTGRAKWSEGELRLDPQLTLYSYVEGTPDVRVDQYIDLKKGPVYVGGESIRTPNDAEIFIDHLNEVAGYVKKGIFPKTPIDSWVCNRKHCSFYEICRGKKK